MTKPYKKKLIEVAIPLEAINAASMHEKSVKQGHPSSLHQWWARRPLAACRAVLFAQLVDDPSAHPEEFPTHLEQETERRRLFSIIEDLVKWENSANKEVIERAQNEIRRSCDGLLPQIYDPFSGAASIPLEAQRLGLPSYGSDLNPVAVMIGKAIVELPQIFNNFPPINPELNKNKLKKYLFTYRGAQGLSADVRYYGARIKEMAEKLAGR